MYKWMIAGVSLSLVFLLIFLYLFLSRTRGRLVDDENSWLRTLPVAHRGLHDQSAPENSLSAFQNAIDANYAIELDVQLTSDGVLVVFHDENLKRMTGVDRNIADSTWDELKDLPLGDEEDTIPLFTDVLTLIDGQVPLLVEIKNEGETGELERRLADMLAGYNGEVAVQAFNPLVLKWFRQHAPAVIRGQLSGDFKGEDLIWYKKILLRHLMLNFLARPDFIAYDLDALPHGRLAQLRRKGVPVLVWTVRNTGDRERSAGLADNIIFEGFLP